MELRSAGLEVDLFPIQAFGAEGVGEEDDAGVGIMDVPLLSQVVEADVRGPDDVESPERAEVDRFGIKAVDLTAD